VSAGVALGQVGLPEPTVGLILSAAALTGLVGVLLVAVLGSRFGRAVPLAVLLVAGGICKFLAVTTTSGPVFIAAILSWSVWYPATITYLVALAASLQRAGRWAALAQSAYLCGATLAPLAGSILVEILGYHPTGWLLGGSSVLLAVPLAFLAHRADRPRPVTEATRTTRGHESSGPAAVR
jgi:MFS transporter, DHA1 family, inner membrane transport protein